jgi:hypothetical protein
LRETKEVVTFAPASRNTLTSVDWDEKRRQEHVPRHIELTAVLTEMLEQKNKSNRIERFEKTDRIGVE